MKHTQKRQFKEKLYSQFARVGKALANNHRLELLELLGQAERSVEMLARETDLSVANASQHLQVLYKAGLLQYRREGTFIFYQLADGAFLLWQSLRDLAQKQIAEVEHLVASLERDDQAIELKELQLLEDIVLLDVRPMNEYMAGHIPKAISMPIIELEMRLEILPKAFEIVAYCRGPFCVFADEAVALLRSHGFQARRLALGLPDWQMAGYPVQKGVGA